MTPLEHYQRDLLREDFAADPAQEHAVNKLQALYDALTQSRPGPRGVRARLQAIFRADDPPAPIRGLYFWGGVGRGKTYLMDVFYESLPFEQKMRVHFHRFMQQVHRDLKHYAGYKNPLALIAAATARQTRVICFDEFFVSDITDAMILGGLFEHLFEHGVTLVATSNIVPDRLYENGLQRQRFLPAIELIKQNTEVVQLDGGVDYRLRTLERAELYHFPLDEGADASLKESFDRLAPEPGVAGQQIEIAGRSLQSRFCADDVIWFDFRELCDGPRSQNDYIELARIYHAVLLSNVPLMSARNDDQARRFINLVDEFYDRHVKLVISAEVALEQLYAGGRLDFEFQRTISRLLEMQSRAYLAKPHRP